MGMKFEKWLEKFLEEKGVDLEDSFEVQGDSGLNIIQYGVVMELMIITGKEEQKAIKDMMVKIDFKGGDIKDYMRHLGQALAK